jgi:prevent-host-death family protein
MTITATQLKQKTYLIDNAIKEDIRVTKRNRPFVVIVDAKRYEELLANQVKKRDTKLLADAFKALSKNVSKIDPDIDIVKLDEEMYRDIF